MFDNTAIFGFKGEDVDEIFEYLLEKDIEVKDVFEEEDQIIVYGESSDFHAIQEALKEKGITEFSVAEIQMLAQNEVELSEEDLAQFEKMIDALDELEDVQQIFHNVDMD